MTCGYLMSEILRIFLKLKRNSSMGVANSRSIIPRVDLQPGGETEKPQAPSVKMFLPDVHMKVWGISIRNPTFS